MNLKAIFFSFLLSLLLVGCTQRTNTSDHLITDEAYRNEVEAQFAYRKELAVRRDSSLFHVFTTPLSAQQTEALQFLYAYMPLSDLADYNGEFFLKQVNYALLARETFTWGKDMPEDIFLHFVLPCRVNNENLDTARVVFFRELKERIKGLSDEEAALEVNHWCHEKVCYRGSDSRTSSPLATLKSSFGRCGEESTFAVAALRSVGIPARQVYTPRWAHQDDNHAWVEVYVGGKWQYMGACEPEAKLNVGWFDVPAKRAMMVHTKAFGAYHGQEEMVKTEKLFAELNTLSVYAESKKLSITITDEKGQAVEDAKIDLGLYNYAEFYPIASLMSDTKGMNTVTCGKGDMLVWASKGNRYGYSIVKADTDKATVVLNQQPGREYTESYDLTVPSEKNVPMLSTELLKANSIRLAHEDSIRNAYMNTFMKPEEARAFARQLKLDEEKVADFLLKSYGNYEEIKRYIQLYASHPLVLTLLETVSEKDLRDITAKTLMSHLDFTKPNIDVPMEIYKEGILSPRIKNEMIRNWRPVLQERLELEFREAIQKDIATLVEWTNRNIVIDTTNNYYRCPISPEGVFKMCRADKASRDIFFVAVCRATEIPARLHPATGTVQVYENGGWKDISFEEKVVEQSKARLTLIYQDKENLKPEYYIHYTLQKFTNGTFVTLDYEGSPFVKNFPFTLEIDPGYYRLMTGHRYTDGNVRTKLTYFNIAANQTRSEAVEILPLEVRKEVLGRINMNDTIALLDGKTITLAELATGKGLVLGLVDPANEPTRHIMVDIPAVKGEFDTWGGKIIFAVPDDKITQAFDATTYTNLPKGALFAVDKDRVLLRKVLKQCGKSDEVLPTMLFVTESGEVVYLSQGYRIGIGENLLKAAKFN